MQISILGSGNIGSTLGKKWAKAGHSVTFAARNMNDPKYQHLLEAIDGNATIATLPEAVSSAEIILFAIPGTAVEETVAELGEALDDKIIIDVTNKVRQAEMNSIAAISARAPNAKLYRAFSSLGWENFDTPRLGDTRIGFFLWRYRQSKRNGRSINRRCWAATDSCWKSGPGSGRRQPDTAVVCSGLRARLRPSISF